MPSPSILEIFSSSIATIHQLLKTNLKTEVDESPYVSSIQSLKGSTPGEKLKDFNNIVRELIGTLNNRGELINLNEIREVSPAMTPLVRTTVGVKLGIVDLVVEGLMSDDIVVVKKALRANWFFNGSSVSANYLINHVIPFVSVRTRLEIVKKLSDCMKKYNEAEELFSTLFDLYGLESSIQLLTACSEPFITNAVVQFKIVLTPKMLSKLYEKHPELAVRYLQLGNKKNLNNVRERELHEIQLNEYDTFLPTLIRKHAKDFLDLYKMTPEKMIKLSTSKTEKIMQEAKDMILKEPQIFLKILSLKHVMNKLSKDEYVVILENLLPQNIDEFNFHEVIEYLQYYKYGDKIELLKDQFQKVYQKGLLDDEKKLDLSKLFKILPLEERKSYAKLLFNRYDDKTTIDIKYISYLPPSESFPMLKEKINKSCNLDETAQLICCMIRSCSNYNSKEALIDVLEYYSKLRSKPNIILCHFFECLRQEFDLKSLDEEHWNYLKDIINYAHVKNELFKSNLSLIESVLGNALWAFQNFHNEYVEKLCYLIAESKIEYRQSDTTWNVCQENPELEKKFIEMFFQKIIPHKYPMTDPFWNERVRRFVLALSLIKTINNYNVRNSFVKIKKRAPKLKTGSNNSVATMIKLEDYPWIMKLTSEFFMKFDNESDFKYRKKILMKLLKCNAPQFYEAKVEEYWEIRDIESGHALVLLNSNPKKILANWQDYFIEARKKLYSGSKAAKRFVTTIKWHHEIPVKFIEKSLQEIRENGSVLVLGLLLEGSAFEKIVAPYIPNDERLDLNNPDAKEKFDFTRSIIRASSWTNPPVSFDFVASFCRGDYISSAIGTLASRAHRTPVERILEFGKKLAHKPISLKKPAIRMIQRAVTKGQFRDFLSDMWTTQDNMLMRDTVARMIFEIFIEAPCDDNLFIVKKCLNDLSIDDQAAIERFSDVTRIDVKYVDEYILTYLNKLDNLTKNNINFQTRRNCFCLALDSINEKLMRYLSAETSKFILQKYLFDPYSLEICRAAQNFAVSKYLLSATNDFDDRINNVVEILSQNAENFDMRHPKRRRFYPTNYTLQEFFADTILELSARGSDKSVEIIESLLKIFESKIYPWQEPLSYLALNIYKEYLLADSPKNFGSRCSKRCSDLIEDFSANEAVVTDIANCINEFIANKLFRDEKYPDIKLSIIEGLLEDDNFYGALVSTKLLDETEVHNYDSRYDHIVQLLHHKRNETIQYNLYKHLNRVKFDCNDEIDL